MERYKRERRRKKEQTKCLPCLLYAASVTLFALRVSRKLFAIQKGRLTDSAELSKICFFVTDLIPKVKRPTSNVWSIGSRSAFAGGLILEAKSSKTEGKHE